MRRLVVSAFTFLLLTVVALSGRSEHPATTQVSTATPIVMMVGQPKRLFEPATTTTTTTTPEPPPVEEAPPPPARKERVRAQAATTTTEQSQPAPEQQQAAPVGSGDAESAIAHWFPELYQSAVNVATCESGMNPGAVSRGGGNWGLFQINTVHKNDFTAVTGQPWSEVLNAEYNAQYARKLYDGNGGWGPWTCRYAA